MGIELGHWLPEPRERSGVVAPVRIDPSGAKGPTRGQARGPHWRQTSHGYYVPAHVDGDSPEQRIIEAAAVLPSYGGVTGWGALRWLGGRWFDGLTGGGTEKQPVFLATGSSNLRDQPGIRHTEEGLLPDQVVTFDGIRVTVPVRSLFHEMRRARDAREAARLAAMAAFNDLVAADELEEFITLVGPVEGIGKVREALILMDENCWSPEEAGMLMVWVLDAGLPRPLMNTPIFDRSGRHVGTPDLLDPVAGVAGEYEGVLHLAGKQRAKDIAREALFRDFGLEYFTMLREDKADTTSVVARMLGARRRAKFLGQEARPWSIEPPRWWKPTLTVAQRRTLSDADRARLLAHRRLAA